MRMSFLFVPVVEKGVMSEEVFLPEQPLRMMTSGNFSKVPYMTGYTSEEAYFLLNGEESTEMCSATITMG